MSSLAPIINALERAYTAIRQVNPDAQPAVITVYRSRGKSRGYFHRSQFKSRDEYERTWDEIQIDSTVIKDGAEEVLHTLLHEACHSIAVKREIKDTSRQGRYHNMKFALLAGEIGLETTDQKELDIGGVKFTVPAGVGWVTTGIKPVIKSVYQNTLDDLEEALNLYQDPFAKNGRSTGKSKSRMIKLQCGQCKRIIRASQTVIDEGPIICQPCVCQFVQEDLR